MRTVDDFAAIRRLHRDGLSIRQITKQLGVGRATVRKALGSPQPTPYTLVVPCPAPVFGVFRDIVDAILADDEQSPPKQRHTATQGGVANPGAQMYHFVTRAIDRDERGCNTNCYYQGLIARGDRAGLVVTGRHEVAEAARRQRQAAAQALRNGAAKPPEGRGLLAWLRRWLPWSVLKRTGEKRTSGPG
jgi:AcrR family transcriptional regulator